MSGWITDMADAVEAHEARQAPPSSKAPMPAVPIDDTPTEPATSPRVMEVPVNDGRWTQAEYAALVCHMAQELNNRDIDQLRMQWELQQQQAAAVEHEAHQRSIEEWEAKMKASKLDHAALPRGPPPPCISSMRVLPNVHEALRQNDPKMASHSQPAIKKAPPTSGRPMPSAFYSDVAPPRIGAPAQPPPPAVQQSADTQGLTLPLAKTPMTPCHPPRPPVDALPKHPSMETSSCASKHPLESTTVEGPPSKHVRPKAFPYPDQVFVAASAAVDMPHPSRPCPKGPPADFMPTPPEVMSMKKGPSIDDRSARLNDEGKLVKVKSVLDINWSLPLWEQLAPVLKGGPNPSTSHDKLREIRAQVPELSNHQLEGIFPADNVITVVQKSHGVHKIYMREVAAWVLNATHWFSLLDQAHDDHCMVPRLGRCSSISTLDADIAGLL